MEKLANFQKCAILFRDSNEPKKRVPAMPDPEPPTSLIELIGLLSRQLVDSRACDLSIGLYQHFDYFDSDTISPGAAEGPFKPCRVPYKLGTPASAGVGAMLRYAATPRFALLPLLSQMLQLGFRLFPQGRCPMRVRWRPPHPFRRQPVLPALQLERIYLGGRMAGAPHREAGQRAGRRVAGAVQPPRIPRRLPSLASAVGLARDELVPPLHLLRPMDGFPGGELFRVRLLGR